MAYHMRQRARKQQRYMVCPKCGKRMLYSRYTEDGVRYHVLKCACQTFELPDPTGIYGPFDAYARVIDQYVKEQVEVSQSE